MEEQLLAKRVSVSRSGLGSLRRMLVRLQRLLAPERLHSFAFNQPASLVWIAADRAPELEQLKPPEKFSHRHQRHSGPLLSASNSFREELAASVK